jgi:NADH pyrophosphatase NudC (nudix superfamily)
MTYIPSVAPPEVLTEPASWFAFSGGQLLGTLSGERVDLPLARSLEEFGVATVRTQYLGTLRGRHCFSAEIAQDTPPPEGMGWFGLRRIFGQVD